MELKTCWGDLIFAAEGAKTVLELVNAAIEAKKSLRGADLSDAILSGADLRCANLRGANLSGANLSAADLSDANLSGADLSGANLSDANLRGANLSGANLSGAILSGANLSDANLSAAILSGAILRDANLRAAILRDADLRGAILRGGRIQTLRVFTGLYRYEVWAILFQNGARWVRMGCLWKSLDEWGVGIRASNPAEYPNDGSEKCEERVRAFEFAKDAALRMKAPELEAK